MLILTVVAPVLGTNCYIVAPARGAECVIVDPGAGVAERVIALVAQYGLRPVALLATHGHVDHTWDAAALGDEFDVALRLHEADAYRVADPFGTLGELGRASHDSAGPLAQALSAVGVDPSAYRQPTRLDTFAVDETGTRTLAWSESLVVDFLHAPGHTEGAGLYVAQGAPDVGSVLPLARTQDGDLTQVAFTGDVLFAGTIGRTDLPGGDAPTMRRSLVDPVARLDPGTLVLAGHGPGSTMREELTRNPFLTGRATP